MRRTPILLLLAAATFAAPMVASAATQDRYGPPSTATRQAETVQAASAQDAPAPKTLLKWTGKDRPARIAAVAVTAPATAPATNPQPQGPARFAAQPAAQQTPIRAPAPTQLLGGPSAPAAQPSIYSPPARMAAPPATAPQAVAQPMPAAARPAPATPSRGPRLYSVAREFGMQPDPTPVAVHNRDGVGMTLTEVPTNDIPPEEDLPLHRRVTNAAGQTQIVERPRAASTN